MYLTWKKRLTNIKEEEKALQQLKRGKATDDNTITPEMLKTWENRA